jgi:uncharacterized protein YciI
LDAKMQDYGRERTTGFLLKDYYVVFAEPRTNSGDRPLPHLDEKEHKRIFDEHIAHQLRLEESGHLFAAGPLLDEQGKRIGASFCAPIRSRRRGRLSIRTRTAHQGCGTTRFTGGA